MGDESEALQDWEDGYQAEEQYEEEQREIRQEKYFKKLSDMKGRYEDNKKSAIGTTIRCAGCGRQIVKRSYQTQFCSNKGFGNCKDKYWNNVPEERRDRACFIVKNV